MMQSWADYLDRLKGGNDATSMSQLAKKIQLNP